MEERMLNTILSEFKNLNERLNHMDEEIQNKFDLIDARFNTLEGIVLSMQNDIDYLQDKISKLENTIEDIQERLTYLENVIEDILNRMLKFENRLDSLEKITLRMEYTFNDKISALFDAHSYYSDQYEKLERRIRQNEIKIANLSISKC